MIKLFVTGSTLALAASAVAQARTAAPETTAVTEVVVTASRLDLLGKALTASQGSVTAKEVALRPIFRPGQLYETVPGLVVTIHSGEGKANQYLLRGFNLDHGTDFASFVDGMPVNRPTNTHGQGYSDQGFLMPQIVGGIDYTKGPYYAAIGDFGAVGSAHVRLLDELPAEASVSLSTLGGQDLYAGGTRYFGDTDRLWGALALSHYDGPWSPPSDFRKLNAAARFSHGDAANGFSLTGLAYTSRGGLETDQPQRAVDQGLIGRYGVLDPTDASRSERYSLSGAYGATGDAWSLRASAYGIHSRMVLWNNFTHFLDDDVNGDQEQQDESRNTVGGELAVTLKAAVFGIASETTVGVQERYDTLFIDKRHTLGRQALDYCDIESAPPNGLPLPADARASLVATAFAAVGGACNADRVRLNDVALYIQTVTRWTPWLRTEVGLRGELYAARDHSLTTGFAGSARQTLVQPKGSLILGPWGKTELYVSAGRGFHSDDVRGVLGTVAREGFPGVAGTTPLLAPATGQEVGLRSNIIPNVQLQLAVFQEAFRSELAYDADAGQDSASAPSRRQGVELSGQYRPAPWLELNTDLAVARARYRGNLAAFDLDGPYIANAPSFIGSMGVLVDHLGPWFGGLQWRKLGAYPIRDGDKDPQDKGYSEVNLDVGYRFSPRLRVQVGVFNLLNAHANASAYSYAARLPGEPDAGVEGVQVHPLEPISARFTVTAGF